MKAFELDEEAHAALGEVEETLIVLDPEGAGPALMLRIHRGEIEVGPAHAVRPDVSIRGRPRALLAHLASWFRPGPVRPLGVRIEGDRERLTRIVAICQGLDPDWEEPLARVLGDAPARHLGQLARAARDWAAHAGGRARSAASEYLQYESGALPSRLEWHEHVRGLRRLERRLATLERRLDARRPASGEERC
jgi:ubiquinone biosynthesis protein UbiJ